MSTFHDEEKKMLEGKTLNAVLRISVRIQAALNYAIECEIHHHGVIKSDELARGLAHAFGSMLGNFYFNGAEQGWFKDDPQIKEGLVKAILQSAANDFMQVESDNGVFLGQIDGSKSGRA